MQTKINFTEKQGQYLAFISLYIKVNGQSPAETDFQRYFKVTPPTVHQMIVKLENLGHISKIPRVARSIKLQIPLNEIPELKDV